MEKSGPRLRANRRNQNTLLALLRELREERGLRQADIAKTLSCPQSVISKYESGERRLDILELRDICGALGISLQQFAERLEHALGPGASRAQTKPSK
jgi:transcriptional regulator with XRE-family HTH domain